MILLGKLLVGEKGELNWMIINYSYQQLRTQKKKLDSAAHTNSVYINHSVAFALWTPMLTWEKVPLANPWTKLLNFIKKQLLQ